MVVSTSKIDALVGLDERRVEYGNTFGLETVSGLTRLTIGVDQVQDAWIHELASDLISPFQMLYILHTTRTSSQLGRYESPRLSAAQLDEFLVKFGPFFAQDSRHDVWIRSHHDDATIVLDRHNLIYAYGPVSTFTDILLTIGAAPRGLPRVPNPHVHHYHAAWDDSERQVLAAFSWIRKPLQYGDIQHKRCGRK